MSIRLYRPSWAASSSTISNRFGRQWQVYIEAEGRLPARRAENVGQFFVKNTKGQMVPPRWLSQDSKPRPGPEFTMRFNEYRSAQINGAAAPGYSAGQAMAAIERSLRPNHAREMGLRLYGACPSRRKKGPARRFPPPRFFRFFPPFSSF